MCDIAALYGIDNLSNDMERHLWLGHSLPPEIAHRSTDARSRWRKVEMTELVDAVLPDSTLTLSSFHRKLKEAVEFVSVFGEEYPADFKKNLKDYLEECTTTTQEK